MTDRHLRASLAALAVCALSIACSDEPPTAPGDDAGADALEETTTLEPLDLGTFLSDRAHVLSSSEYELVSSVEELEAGLYRYRTLVDSFPTIERDDFVVGETDEGFVRLVLDATVANGTLTLDTGPAYWHDVLKAGTYQVTIPLSGDEEPTLTVNGVAQVSFPLQADSLQLPPLEQTFSDVDVCAWLDEKWQTRHPEPFCGADKQAEATIARNVFSIDGTLDSLKIVSGWVRLTGEADIAMTVDPGGLRGGSAPVFSPCNVGRYLGCLETPTGAALIDFLRRYAPAIPDSALPPIRVCIPGTYVRTARGYWSGLTYHPPVWATCRITNLGELPTIVPGTFEAAAFELRPELKGSLDIRVVGDGTVGVEIAIPTMSVSRGITSSQHFAGKIQAGLFVPLSIAFNNNKATIRVDFHQKNQLHQEWNPSDGWSRYNEPVFHELKPTLLEFERPDTLVVATGALIKAEAVLCAAIVKCDLQFDSASAVAPPPEVGPAAVDSTGIIGRILSKLEIQEKFTVEGRQFVEAHWTREQVHPTDSLIDNWKIALEGGWAGKLGFDLDIPGERFVLPPVLQEGSWDFEASRSRLADFWGQARFKVTTTTTGVDVDSDGYTVMIQRTDTLPTLVPPGVERVTRGPSIYTDQLVPLEISLNPNESKEVGLPEWLPCEVVYSDFLVFAAGPGVGAIIEGARVNGVGIPTYAITPLCPLTVAQYDIELTGVSENCSVANGAARDSVWLQQSRNEPPRTDTTFIQFDVTCVDAGTPGNIHLTLTNELGLEPRPTVTLDGGGRWPLPTDTVTLTGLTPGARVLQVTDLPSNCVSDPVDVTVSPGGTTNVDALITCAAPDVPPVGKVVYVSSLTGIGDDPDGYYVRVDGLGSAALATRDTAIVADLPAETPTVTMVAGIAGNCRAEAPNPRVVTLNATRETVWVPFPVSCTDAVPDTVDALVDATGWPTTTVTLRTANGGSLGANGPLVTELARLAGTSVRAWGVMSPTGMNVYGYDLQSSLGDDRWAGIVLVRSGVTWLLGEDAIRLIDPPATLSALEGAYVWVTGVEALDGVQPTLFGVIRDPA